MNGCDGKALLIHLNASDDRGIEVIRNQISMFVKSYPLLNKGMKFVVFDEVDYMTKNAQQALRYLINEYSSTVRFCLICNYISKIDDALQSELLRLKFNNLINRVIVIPFSSDKMRLNFDDYSFYILFEVDMLKDHDNSYQLDIDWKINKKDIIINEKDCGYSDFNLNDFSY